MPIKHNLLAGRYEFDVVLAFAYMTMVDAYKGNCSCFASFKVVVCSGTTLKGDMLVMVQSILLRCGKLSEGQGVSREQE